MRRITMLLMAAAFMAVMMVASAAPAMANDLFDDNDLDHFGGVLNDNDVLDNDLFDNDHRHLFDNDRRDLFDDNDRHGLFNGGGPICHDADTEPELIVGIGFVCVDEDHLFDRHLFDNDRRDLFDNDRRDLFDDNDRRGDLFDDNGGFLGFGGIEQDSRSGNVGIGSDVS